MSSLYNRTRLWINPGFQCRILFRVGFYLAASSFIVFHLAFLCELLFQLISRSPKGFVACYLDFLQQHRFILFGWAIFMPWVLYDVLKVSHRVAGPLHRCRSLMLEMANGKTVPEFKPRKYDLMPEFFEAFNLLVKHSNASVSAAENDQNRYAERSGMAYKENSHILAN